MGECSVQARSMVYSLVRVELSTLGIQGQPCELWLQPTKGLNKLLPNKNATFFTEMGEEDEL